MDLRSGRLELPESGTKSGMNNLNEQTNTTEESEVVAVMINDLPDEILENIFSRVSPYGDLEAVKSTSARWNRLAKKVVLTKQNTFEQAIISGNLQCEVFSSRFNEAGRLVEPWITERFGHMCCYYDTGVYVVGGTTHTPTTFNDMWRFDLNSRTWSRCLASGQYPSPKALASFVQYKDNLVLFGGWSHPAPYPLMQPWRIFDELHIYNFSSNRWSQIVTAHCPHPSAGHSASVHGDQMIIFGGRTFNQKEQSYPLSKSVWVFDFNDQEWYLVKTNDEIPARYGQTQINVDDSHVLIIGGCGGPNQIFSDVWLLHFYREGPRRQYVGSWTEVITNNMDIVIPNDFHYSGCKIGTSVIFFERSSPLSPFLAFLHFDSQASLSAEHNGLVFEASPRSYFHSRCSSGLRHQVAATMPMYTLDISKVLTDNCVSWSKEPSPPKFRRPNERLLYSMVIGRAEIILFGGFYKQPNVSRCSVSNDVFVLKTVHKSY